MNSDKTYFKAQDIIAQRRQRAITLMQQREECITAKLPQYVELQKAKLVAGIASARAAISGANTPEAISAMAQLKAIDTQIADCLAVNGIDPASLTPDYVCKVCRDTGREQSGKLCQCVHMLSQELRREELSKSSPLFLCAFDSFSLQKYPNEIVNNINVREYMSGVLDYCKAYAEDFGTNSQSLYMCGNAGLGKTHLALSIANIALKKGFNVVYTSAQGVFDTIEREHFTPNGGTALNSLLAAQLLILDDLGTEYLTPYIGSCLYDIINTRWNKHLPTIYTSNFVRMDELSKRYTEKIVSRLMGSCETLHFIGEDIRLQNK